MNGMMNIHAAIDNETFLMKSGDVMIQFGAGKVDFHGVYAELKKAGFR